jgi:hypothetical protein
MFRAVKCAYLTYINARSRFLERERLAILLAHVGMKAVLDVKIGRPIGDPDPGCGQFEPRTAQGREDSSSENQKCTKVL